MLEVKAKMLKKKKSSHANASAVALKWMICIIYEGLWSSKWPYGGVANRI